MTTPASRDATASVDRGHQVVAFHSDKGWIVAVLIVSAGLLAAFVHAASWALRDSWRVLTVTGVRRADDVFLIVFTLVLLALCAGLLGLTVLAVRAWRVRDVPRLTLGPDGITDCRSATGPIPWSAIADARIEWGGRSGPTRLWLTLEGEGEARKKPLALGALRENPADLLAALKGYPAYRGR